MFSWLRTKKSMAEEIKSLRNRLSILETQNRIATNALARSNAQLATFKRVRQETPPLPIKKVDHLARAQQVERAYRQAPRAAAQAYPEPRAGRDPDPADALMNVALGAGAAMVLDSIFSDDKPSQSCSAPSSPSFDSGGGGDFGGGGASGSWND